MKRLVCLICIGGMVACGGDGGLSSAAPTANAAPTADAGGSQIVDEKSSVTLDGSNSHDPDGSIGGYQWQQISGPLVTLIGALTATPSFTAPIVAGPTALTFRLTVTDNEGMSTDSTVTVTVERLTVSAPDVVGLTEAQATIDLATAGLVVGSMTTQNHDTVPPGNVISQNPVAGAIVPERSRVDLVVSLGALDFDVRPSNTSCLAPPRPTSGASVATMEAFPNLPSFNLPVKILVEPVPNPRWFVLEKDGLVRVFDPAVATSISTYIDLTDAVRAEQDGGLLGMDFHPDYPNTPEIFLFYARDHTFPNTRSVISRFILDNVATPVSVTGQVILEVDQSRDIHFGGDIAFGPDGQFYISLGDGGPQEDPNNNAQDTRLLLGSMLRIDVLDPRVSHPDNPYVIPANNPFATNSKCGPALNANACPEIYAWGFRNPWRWSFDQPTGALWLADVGHKNWEEVDLVELGGNYGWRCREGGHDFNTSGCVAGLIDPVAEYRNDGTNASITGGYVYRGTAIPELVGRYVFGDFVSGRIWALQSDGQGGFIRDELINTRFGISTFGIDQLGELYFADLFSGRIYKIVPSGPGNPDTIATLLSDTGCVDSANPTQPASGLIPYDINAPFWSDGAVKERFLAVPDGTTIAINANDDWDLPPGSVIVKNFRINGKLIETRLLMRHPDGVWAGYPYEWNATDTEATRVRGGKTVLIDGQSYSIPSEGECMSCHTSVAGFSLGPETAQLNRDFRYPNTGRTANQLTTLDHIMMFSAPLPDMPPADFPQLTDPDDTGANLDDRARAYLHTNCAQCHRGPSSPTPSDMDFRYTTRLNNINACNAIPRNGDLGISNPRIIAPGDADRSVLIERMSRRDSAGMPPLASNLPDSTGVALITSWVNGLANCN